MKYAYSPHTFELIITDTPAEWMLTTDLPPPQFDNQTSGCFFKNGSWITVPTQIDTTVPAKKIRAIRDALIVQTQTKIDRALRQIRMGQQPIDDVASLDKYIQELSDVPDQIGFPLDVIWPELK